MSYKEDGDKKARQWWIDYPGDPRVDPLEGETYRGWTHTHETAYKAGHDAGLQSSVVKEAIAVIDYHRKTICACYEAFGRYNKCKACRCLENYESALREIGEKS